MTTAFRLVLAMILCSLTLAWAQQGRLEGGDLQLESGEYYDVYFHDGVAGGQLEVALASDDFDAYLVVLAPDGSGLHQEDDTPGHGLGVSTVIQLPSTGRYTVVVTSAFAGETGAYSLTMSGGAQAPGAPAAVAGPATNPLAPAAPASPFAGSFAGDGVDLTLRVNGASVSGSLGVGGGSYTVAGSITGDTLSGTFGDAAQRYPLSIRVQGASLLLESGGGSYVLAPVGTPGATAPVAPGAPAAPAAPTAPDAPAAVPAPTGPVLPLGPRSSAPRAQGDRPVPGIAPRPGFVSGTVFDTQGRPLAGAGVLISGTTYVQGQRTSFETVTGADGTYSVRVPDGRYGAKAWIDVDYQGVTFSRVLHPLSGNPNSEIDSEVGGNIDFQWVLTGLISPPGDDASDYYGASIDFAYCGLPADAYCSFDYGAFPDRPIAPGGSTVRVTLVPVAPLLDGSQGETLTFEFTVMEQDAEYPYGGAPNAPAGYEGGGGGRTVLGAKWEYRSEYLYDLPVGVYDMSAVAIFPDGRAQPLLLGLTEDDVEHTTLRVSFTPWDSFSGRSYSGGGIDELDVYVRD